MQNYSRAKHILDLALSSSNSETNCITAAALSPTLYVDEVPGASADDREYTTLETASFQHILPSAISELAVQESSSSTSYLHSAPAQIQENELPIDDQESAEKSSSSEFLKTKKRKLTDVENRRQVQEEKHPLLPACNCKKKCNDFIDESKRQELHSSFWKLDLQRRRDYITNAIITKEVQTRRVDSKQCRERTLEYRMNGVKVCKLFFLSTLGYKHDNVVRCLLASNERASPDDLRAGASQDMRGRSEPANKFSAEYKEQVIQFIESYKPCVSHYRLLHAPNRRYLPPGLTPSSLYRDLKKEFESKEQLVCSWTYFHRIYHSLNISTSIPENDKCTICTEHQNNHDDEEHLCKECLCNLCSLFPNHKENAKSARIELQKDTEMFVNDKDYLLVSVDMQKVLLMPKLETKEYYFSRKLVLFNETFAEPGKNGKSWAILWHEGEAGRSASEISSAYVNFLFQTSQNKKFAILYADNCSSQNKCWILYSTLVKVVNSSEYSLETITIKYFEPGHSYMPCDSVHATITNALKRQSVIGDFFEYVQLIENCKKNLRVILMDHSQFKINSNDKKTNVNLKLEQIKQVQFRKGSLSLFYKESHNATNDWKENSFIKIKTQKTLQEKMNMGGIISLVPVEKIYKEGPRGISSEKKRDLIRLCPSLPVRSRMFFHQLIDNGNLKDLDTVSGD